MNAFPGSRALLVGAAFLPLLAVAGATPTVTVVAHLGGTPDGYGAQAPPTQGADGNFYGPTAAGGPTGYGTIYRLTPAGTLTTLYAFKGGADGGNPAAALILGPDGSLYGTTPRLSGGDDQGTVFSVTTAGVLTTLHHFSAVDANSANADGADPEAALLLGTDGNFYGTTAAGGTTGSGTVFRVTSGGTLTSLHSFTRASDTDFYGPLTALAQGTDGSFYGTARGGGSGRGVVFSLTPAGAASLRHTFTGGDGGSYPGSLVRGADGNFYGLTASDGQGSSLGTAFRITPAGELTTLHEFDYTTGGRIPGTENAPPPPLAQDAAGNFYGPTAETVYSDGGTIFRLTPAGDVAVVHAFPFLSNQGGPFPTHTVIGSYPEGADPAGVTFGADGNLYGVTKVGYAPFANDSQDSSFRGTVFRLTPAGTLTTDYRFNASTADQGTGALAQAADGSFYGFTSDPGTDQGAIVRVTPDGAVSTLHAFDRSAYGPYPSSGLVLARDGTFYGTAEFSDDGGGAIFSLTTAGTFTLRYRFAGYPAEAYPNSTLVPGADGTLLYGTTGGTVFSFNPATGEEKVLHDFGDGRAGTGANGVVANADGTLLYGTTSMGGGAQGAGVVFVLDPAHGDYRVLHAFQGTDDGAQPTANLTLGRDGNFYGQTPVARISPSDPGNGTIFRVAPDGTFTTVHTFASDGSEGTGTRDALVQGNDGNLYGTSGSSGVTKPLLFSLAPDGRFTTIGPALSYNGPLIQGTDGNLYGLTADGGVHGAGTVIRVNLGPTTFPPQVSLSAAVPAVTADGGNVGEFLLTLDHAYYADLFVAYAVKGSATPGADYVALKGTAKVKAGKTTKVIKITPTGDLGGASKKVVTLLLAPGDGYTVGTTGKVKVKVYSASR